MTVKIAGKLNAFFHFLDEILFGAWCLYTEMPSRDWVGWLQNPIADYYLVLECDHKFATKMKIAERLEEAGVKVINEGDDAKCVVFSISLEPLDTEGFSLCNLWKNKQWTENLDPCGYLKEVIGETDIPPRGTR